MRLQYLCPSLLFVCISLLEVTGAQSPSAQSAPQASPSPSTLSQKPGAKTISLDDAIQMALKHNHNLLAARTTIDQNKAEETTANLRPNPVLMGDSQFFP